MTGRRMDLSALVGGRARQQAVVMLAAILGLQSADSGAIGALAGPIESAFHVGNVDIGLLVTVTTLIGAVASLPFGVLIDRRNRTRLLAVVALLWGCSTAFSGLSTSFGMLLGVRVFQAGITAVAGPAVASLAGDLFPGDERGRLWGYVLTGELAGAGVGILVAGLVSDAAGWRAAIIVLAVPAWVLAWALYRHFPEPARGGAGQIRRGDVAIRTAAERPAGSQAAALPPEPPQPSALERQAEAQGVVADPRAVLSDPGEISLRRAVPYVLRIRSNDALIIASGLGYFFLQGVQTFGVLWLRERFAVGQALASIVFLLVSVGALLGVLVSGRAADRLIARGWTAARMIVGAVTFAGTTLVFAPAMFITSLSVATPVLLLASVFVGAVNPPVDTARLDVVPSFLWGRAEAIRTTLRQTMQGFAPLLFGLVSAALGASKTGFGAGVDTSAARLSSAAGASLGLTFVVFSVPLLLAAAVLWLSRNAYLRDVVAAWRSDAARGRGSGATAGGSVT